MDSQNADQNPGQNAEMTPESPGPDHTPADTNLAADAPGAPEDLTDPLDELGQSDEERIDTVTERNESLEERLPHDHRP